MDEHYDEQYVLDSLAKSVYSLIMFVYKNNDDGFKEFNKLFDDDIDKRNKFLENMHRSKMNKTDVDTIKTTYYNKLRRNLMDS